MELWGSHSFANLQVVKKALFKTKINPVKPAMLSFA
jgi:hypothetical protein